ncbi:MAG: AMED_5909 family protein [Pseudonocardiaceae bacterium]
MIVDQVTEPSPPQTLVEAHVALARVRPRLDSPLQEWLSYHQRSAALYAEIAEIDRGHHHEALYFGEQERDSEQKIKNRIAT